MAKKVAVKKLAKKTRISKYDVLKKDVSDYAASIRLRSVVQHSSTPATATKNGITGKATIEVNELITVVKTARALGKVVTLDATMTDLIVNLVDPVPPTPLHFY
jgi:hypothetical protein